MWGCGEGVGEEERLSSLDEDVLEAELALELDRRGHAREACAHHDAAGEGRRGQCAVGRGDVEEATRTNAV